MASLCNKQTLMHGGPHHIPSLGSIQLFQATYYGAHPSPVCRTQTFLDRTTCSVSMTVPSMGKFYNRKRRKRGIPRHYTQLHNYRHANSLGTITSIFPNTLSRQSVTVSGCQWADCQYRNPIFQLYCLVTATLTIAHTDTPSAIRASFHPLPGHQALKRAAGGSELCSTPRKAHAPYSAHECASPYKKWERKVKNKTSDIHTHSNGI